MRQKPSIAYFLYNTKQSGGVQVVLELASRMKKRGYPVTVYALFPEEIDWFKERIVVKSIFSAFFISHKIAIATFWPTAYLLLGIRAKQKMYVVLGWEEAFYHNILLKWLARFSLKLPFKQITISDYLKQKIYGYTGKNDIELTHVGNIDLTKFSAPTRLEKKQKVILSVVSAYRAYKGVDLLTRAVKEIKKNHPDYLFILVSAKEKKAYDLVFDQFYSGISQQALIDLYQKADVLLVTARDEGLFLPGLEAMACGAILVSTASGGISEYAKHKKNAVILSSLEELWEKDVLGKLFSDTTYQVRLRRNGLLTVQQYSWENALEKLDKIMSEV